MSYYAKFFQRIADVIDSGEMTIDELCARFGISKKKLSIMEKNEWFPTVPDVKRICENMGWDFQEILHEIINDIEIIYIPKVAYLKTAKYKKELNIKTEEPIDIVQVDLDSILRGIFKDREIFESSDGVIINQGKVFISEKLIDVKEVRNHQYIRNRVTRTAFPGTRAVIMDHVELLYVLRGFNR